MFYNVEHICKIYIHVYKPGMAKLDSRGGVFGKYPPPSLENFPKYPPPRIGARGPPLSENFGRKWRILPEIRPFCSPFSVISGI